MLEIQLLGHIVDKDDICHNPVKTEAFFQIPPFQDVQQMRSYLGTVNARFVKQMRYLRTIMDLL